MNIMYGGNLRPSARPLIDGASLAHFLLEARQASDRPTKGHVSIQIADKTISASAEFDHATNTLFISGSI